MNKFLVKLFYDLDKLVLLYFFLLFFTYPLFFRHIFSTILHSSYNSYSIILTSVIFFLFFFTFYLCRKFNFVRFDYDFSEWSEKRSIIFIFLFPLLIFLAKYIRLKGDLTRECLLNFYFSPHIGYFILTSFIFTCSLQNNFKFKKSFLYLFYFICILFILNAIFNTHSRIELIFFFGIMLLRFIIYSKKYTLTLFLVTSIFVLFNFQNTLKTHLPKNIIGCSSLNYIQHGFKDDYKKGTAQLTKGEWPTTTLQKIFYPIIVRLSSQHVFSKVADYVRQNGPINTLPTLYKNILPDIVKKENTQNINGNDLARKFGLISKEDRVTGVSPTLIGEFYLNFGLFSLIFMPLVPMIYYFFSYNGKLNSTRGLFFYIIISFIMIHGFEGFVYSLLQKLSTSIFIMAIIVLFVRKYSFFKNNLFLKYLD